MIKPIERGEAVRRAAGAKGGAGHMVGKQAANPQKPGGTAHDVKGKAPGAKFARGGPPIRGVSLSTPAKGGAHRSA
jgi:hypothetical protein